MATTRATYHHGDLRASLIRCGKALLARDGIQNLSLRAVTREAGVSHGAPRNEFSDLNGLLAAIATEGFEEIIALRERAMARYAEPEARLKAILRVYIDFAAENPDLFWLVYGPQIRDRTHYPELMAAANRSYAVLRDCVFEYLRAAGHAQACSEELVLCAWSSVHGMAMLFNGRPQAPSVRHALSFTKWRTSVIDFVLAGLLARASSVAGGVDEQVESHP